MNPAGQQRLGVMLVVRETLTHEFVDRVRLLSFVPTPKFTSLLFLDFSSLSQNLKRGHVDQVCLRAGKAVDHHDLIRRGRCRNLTSMLNVHPCGWAAKDEIFQGS